MRHPTEVAAIRRAVDEGRGPSAPLVLRAREIVVAAAEPERETLLQRKLRSGEFVVSVEIDPPRGGNARAMLELARTLAESGHVDVVDVNDNPRARARMNALMLSVAIQREAGIETIPHVTPRDATVMGLEGVLLGAPAEGVPSSMIWLRETFCLWGRTGLAKDNIFLMTSRAFKEAFWIFSRSSSAC